LEATGHRDTASCVAAAVSCRQQLVLLPVLPRATWHTLLNDVEVRQQQQLYCFVVSSSVEVSIWY
jgi:hypothetical protein